MLDERDFFDPATLHPGGAVVARDVRTTAMQDALRRLDRVGAPLPQPIRRALFNWDATILLDCVDLASLADFVEDLSAPRRRPQAHQVPSTVEGRAAMSRESIKRLERLGAPLRGRFPHGDYEETRLQVSYSEMDEFARDVEERASSHKSGFSKP